MFFISNINSNMIKGYMVHLYTTTGIVLGILAVRQIYEQNLDFVFMYLAISLFIDGTDGYLARKYNVLKYASRINGMILDAIVDFFNYVIVPVLVIIQFNFVPENFVYISAILILCASCFTFANTKQKTKDNYFEGFPALWNVLILNFYIINTSQIINLSLIISCVALTFVPIKFVHPLRVESYKLWAILSFILWGLSTALLLFVFQDNTIEYRLGFYTWIASNIFIMLFSIFRTINKSFSINS